MSPRLSNGGTGALEALNPIPPITSAIGYGGRIQTLIVLRGTKVRRFLRRAAQEKGKSRNKVYRKRGTGIGKLTHLRFSQDVLLLRTFFELENQNRGRVAYLRKDKKKPFEMPQRRSSECIR